MQIETQEKLLEKSPAKYLLRALKAFYFYQVIRLDASIEC